MLRLKLEEISDVSLFVKRSIVAISGSDDPARSLSILREISNRTYTAETFEKAFCDISDTQALSEAMRRMRRDLLIHLIARDATARADYETVVAMMTRFAEAVVTHTVRVHAQTLARRFGVPTNSDGAPQDFMVVAMGKLGGEELNVSSDIDLVFVYDEEGETRQTDDYPNVRRTVSNQEFFERLSRKVISALNDVDGVGFVFRVDMRLRPFGDSGPIVVSSSMLEEYLYTQGRDWERFAWLKARVVNRAVFSSRSDFEAAVKSLYALVTPFVYRKYVDFSAINSLSRVHAMIREQSAKREAQNPSHINVKLGRGGIREIEFIAQTFQVMRGGRDESLRGRSTLPTLGTLATKGHLPPDVSRRLQADYVFLRNLEHALQYIDDQQTHVLKTDTDDVRTVSRLVGFEASDLLTRLRETRDFVSKTFDAIFHTNTENDPTDDWGIADETDGTESTVFMKKLESLKFVDVRHLARRVNVLMRSPRVSCTQDTRDLFARFIKTVALNAHAWATFKTGSVSADEVFDRYLNLLEVISGRSTYVALLNQYESAATKVGRILAVSRWAADYLSEHPVLLDELVAGRESPVREYDREDWKRWAQALRRRLEANADDQEAQFNVLRDAHHSALFHLLMADLDGLLTVEVLADHLSAIADELVGLTLELAWMRVPSRHCEKPRFAVIAFGKLGGKELGYSSDLDLVFLYDDPAPEALGNYVKLVRRMITWLSAPTSSGILYEVDLRLRPNGEDGLAASSWDAFVHYERNVDGHGAWTWEHQALTRARFCAGDETLGERFEKEREAILCIERDESILNREIPAMREKMHAGHVNRSELFDVKHDRGGMVDIEFIVQKLVLTHAAKHRELTKNLGNTQLLLMAGELGLISGDLAYRVSESYRHYRTVQRMIRLSQGIDAPARIEANLVVRYRSAVLKLWNEVFGERLEFAHSRA